MILKSHRRILITGGFGFIATHLARALAAKGLAITLFDSSEWNGSAACAASLDEQPLVERVQGSVLDKNAVLSLSHQFDAIVHAAGFLGIEKVAESPLHTMDVNVLGSKHVLELAARQTRLRRYVQISTSEVYGQLANSLDEEQPASVPVGASRWCYAASKVAGEHFARAYFYEHGLPVVIVRPFNVYGPYRFGANAMTTLVKGALKGLPLTVSGSGEQTRSWCHVQDFTSGLLAALETEGVDGETFNIGDDRNNLSMLELSRLICHTVGSASSIKSGDSHCQDVLLRKPNIEKARRLLHYEPKIDLEEGIMDLARWLNDSQRGTTTALLQSLSGER